MVEPPLPTLLSRPEKLSLALLVQLPGVVVPLVDITWFHHDDLVEQLIFGGCPSALHHELLHQLLGLVFERDGPLVVEDRA